MRLTNILSIILIIAGLFTAIWAFNILLPGIDSDDYSLVALASLAAWLIGMPAIHEGLSE